jgi:sulfite exporter TauE/SafE
MGGWAALEWPKPFGETLLGKILRALKVDSKLYKHIADNPETLRNAVIILILISLVAGLGNCVYVYNVDKIKSYLEVEGLEILIRGKTSFTPYSLVLSLSYVGMIIINWLLLSLAIYLVTAKLTGFSSDFSTIARAVAFAQVPFAIHIFLPFMFPNEPYLSFNWPVLIWLISAFWIFAGLIVGIKEALDIPFLKAFAIILFAGTLHWIILDKFIYSTLNLPGIILKTTPESSAVTLIAFGLATIIAMFLGAFSRK